MSTELFAQLRRWPDLESPELVAVDAADRLLLASVAQLSSTQRARITVIGDTHGALTLGVLHARVRDDAGEHQPIRVHQDALSGEQALNANAERVAELLTDSSHATPGFEHHELDASLIAGATLVVLRLPRSLDALDEIASLIALHAAPDVVVLAGGRIKHMTRAMNEVLQRYFGRVTVSLAVQKSRILTAREPDATKARLALASWPRVASLDEIGLRVAAHGGVFAGASLDIGTRELLAALPKMEVPPDARVIDLGCGTGLIACAFARAHPEARVLATDQSASAVRSARETVRENAMDARVTVARDNGLSTQADGSADLILFNPPFHSGAAVHADTSLRLFADAGRVLSPGGRLWVVANRHLNYRSSLERLVGPTREVSHTRKFIVSVSTKPDR